MERSDYCRGKFEPGKLVNPGNWLVLQLSGKTSTPPVNIPQLDDKDSFSSESSLELPDIVNIPQLDGNYSFSSDSSLELRDVVNTVNNSVIDPNTNFNPIPVITGFRPPPAKKCERQPTRITIRRDNRSELCLHLPSMGVYNHRSIWKKINNFALEFKELKMGVAFHSEVWEKKEKKQHQNKLEEILELHGIKYISTPRPVQRGGGSAITVDNERFFIKEIKDDNPDNLEITIGILKPKQKLSLGMKLRILIP